MLWAVAIFSLQVLQLHWSCNASLGLPKRFRTVPATCLEESPAASIWSLYRWSMVNVSVWQNHRSQLHSRIQMRLADRYHFESDQMACQICLTEIYLKVPIPSKRPLELKKWAAYDPNPPTEPSSIVISISGSFTSLLISSTSRGLQNRASATVVSIPWVLSESAACLHYETISENGNSFSFHQNPTFSNLLKTNQMRQL